MGRVLKNSVNTSGGGHMPAAYHLLWVVLLASALVTGCGPTAPAATSAPLPTAPPTNTPVPPTAVPPTDTPVPPATIPPTEPPPPTDTTVPPTTMPRPTVTPLPPLTGSGGGVLAFVRALEGSWGIYVMNADGSDERQLTRHGQPVAYPEWSPDGSQIAFHKHQSDAVWSIYVMDADGNHERRLTDTATQDAAPVWSPDGSQIAFSRGSDIWIMNTDGSDQRLLLSDPVPGCCLDWSPDGSRIAFESERDGNAEIYVVDAHGAEQGSGNVQRLTDEGAQDWWPTWSPDGTQIAFMSDRDGDWEIYVMDAEGGNLRQLTDNEADDRGPAWSPDGTRIAFASNRDTGAPFDSEIYIMNADGTDQQRIAATAGFEWGIDWRPEVRPAEGPTPVIPAVSLEKSPQIFEPGFTYQVALGDLDGDGDLDAVFSNMRSSHSQVWLNDGTGSFTDTGQELAQQGHGVALGDLDSDGDLDAFISVATYGATGADSRKPSKVYLNDGTGVLRDSGQDLGDTDLSGTGVDLFDIEGDGDLDALVVYHQAPNRIYLNDGQGVFLDSGRSFPEVSTWGDLDGDGDVDIFVKERGQGYKTLLNDGTGGFSDHWQMANDNVLYGGVALGDLDGDGDTDALVTNGEQSGSHPTILLMNDGTGRFSDSGQRLPPTYWASIGLGDLNGDSHLDAFIVNFLRPDDVWVWLNDGTGHFFESTLDIEGPAGSLGCVLGDLDGDGDPDVFVADFDGGPNEIWFNATP
jgi:Tol biopolymer transport system component